MAKDIQLYDYTGTVKVYPKTHSELVITREGHTVSEALEQLGNEISSVEGNLNSEIDNLKGTVENHEGRIENLEENAIIKDGSITTSKIADRAVTWEKIGFDVIDDVNHLEGRIADLEENAIIKDGSITTEKIADKAISWNKMSDDVSGDIAELFNESAKIVNLTQAEYDSLKTYDFKTIYVITDGKSELDKLTERVDSLSGTGSGSDINLNEYYKKPEVDALVDDIWDGIAEHESQLDSLDGRVDKLEKSGTGGGSGSDTRLDYFLYPSTDDFLDSSKIMYEDVQYGVLGIDLKTLLRQICQQLGIIGGIPEGGNPDSGLED